jgi:hypothetical protein
MSDISRGYQVLIGGLGVAVNALFDQTSMTTESLAHTELIAPKIIKIAQVFVMRQ